jgi:hypothetical protein
VPPGVNSPRPGELPWLVAEIEREALLAVLRTWHNLNYSHFGDALRPPQFAFIDGGQLLGRWHGSTRCIELSRALVREHGWGVMTEVLRHEMAHQYVDEVLKVKDETSHGPAFRLVCEQRGIDSRAAGVPTVGTTSGNERLLERVSHLLALAESTNEHEARNAATMARRLMLRYNLESLASGRLSAYAHRLLGEPATRVWEHRRTIAAILGEHFFVECIWVPMWSHETARFGQQLEICGSPENLDIASYVHGFLESTGAALWTRHRESMGLRGGRGRLEYLSGVMSGFEESLREASKKSAGEGLVWVGDAGLESFFQRRHPYQRTVQYGHRELGETWQHGHAEGKRLVLKRGVSEGSSGAAPKSLPPRRS